MIRLLPFVLLAACAKSPTPTAPAVPEPAPTPSRVRPDPLPERPFVMPEVHRATLSNGLEVLLVENHEVPLWNARLALRSGAWTDPAGKEGLASVTFDMLDEGAGKLDAAGIARELKRLGGDVGAGAGADSASVAVAGPTRNLEPLLGLFADLLLRPTFPEKAWEIVQTRRIADLRASLQNPSAIAARVAPRVVYGEAYRGRQPTEASFQAITVRDMRAFHRRGVDPRNAVLLLGGDLTLDQVLPVLERTLGAWKPAGEVLAPPPVVPDPPERSVVHLVDKPGAAQSVLVAVLPTVPRTHEDYWDLHLANTAFGGAFTARVNMNLREDKGWTYGARCGLDDNLGPSLWTCSTSVQADKTVPALLELQREVREAVGERPLTADEIAYFQGYRVNSFYGRYETPYALLGQLAEIWTYGLPEDWLERYVPSVQAVTDASANEAFRRWIAPERIAWIVVGDEASVRPALEATGQTVVELDRNGNPVQ